MFIFQNVQTIVSTLRFQKTDFTLRFSFYIKDLKFTLRIIELYIKDRIIYIKDLSSDIKDLLFYIKDPNIKVFPKPNHNVKCECLKVEWVGMVSE